MCGWVTKTFSVALFDGDFVLSNNLGSQMYELKASGDFCLLAVTKLISITSAVSFEF